MTDRMKKNGKNGFKPDHTPAEPVDSGRPLTLTIDYEYYQTFLDDMDVPDEQKRELIQTIFSIVVQFVDLGFGISPECQAIRAGKSDVAVESSLKNAKISPFSKEFATMKTASETEKETIKKGKNR
ncbi:MAG: hypothetical protein ACFCUR_07485 [Rhodomicrobiaceae bacterium]